MKTYLCIDLKTFYASVECAERNLDPFETNLVVADPDRCTTTICLAISPKMKAMGIKNRCRLFEIPKDVKYIMAKPRMQKYIDYSANIYAIYLKYIAKEDIHVYSIDEAFLDVTHYLKMYNLSAIELAKKIMDDIYNTLKIKSACGVGTNLYLAKVALDILAKHEKESVAFLDEEAYIQKLSHHTPLSDFWQIGRGIEKRLHKMGIFDMEGIRGADSKKLFKEFGVNATFLIDHASGIEPCTISEIKNYKSKSNSMNSGQILFRDYNYNETKTVILEMTDLLVEELKGRELKANVVSISIGFKRETYPSYHTGIKLDNPSNSFKDISDTLIYLFEKGVNKEALIRKVNISFSNLIYYDIEQLNLFKDSNESIEEANLNKALLGIKNKYGKSSILKAVNLKEEATTRDRNKLIGGHNAN